ncbi:MAG: hypothetical protein ACRD88_02820, partial [Terriglobia bacterium]
GSRFVGVDPRVKPFLDLYDLPNGRLFTDGTGEFINSPKRPIREDYTMVRLDHQFSDSDFLFGRYNFDDAKLSDPDEYSSFSVDSVTRAQYVTIGEKKIFSPTVLK